MTQNSSNIETNTKPIEQIYTVPNIITMIRLMLVPFAFTLLVQGQHDVLAFIIFALAGGSDFVDGQIARRTNQVSELGKVFDPLVDRFLIAAGLTGLFVTARIPLWILCVLIGRDFYLCCGLIRLKVLNAERIDVVFLGKLTTATLLVGFSGLILNWPKTKGLSLVDVSWLPGFNGTLTAIWIYFVYVGMIFSLSAAVIYTFKGIKMAQAAKSLSQSN